VNATTSCFSFGANRKHRRLCQARFARYWMIASG
jgi:hypothetical protein